MNKCKINNFKNKQVIVFALIFIILAVNLYLFKVLDKIGDQAYMNERLRIKSNTDHACLIKIANINYDQKDYNGLLTDVYDTYYTISPYCETDKLTRRYGCRNEKNIAFTNYEMQQCNSDLPSWISVTQEKKQ